LPVEKVRPTVAWDDEERPHSREVYFKGAGFVTTPVYRRTALRTAARVDGPAILEQADSTTLVPPGATGVVLEDGSLLITFATASSDEPDA
jgi:N-methylhydantoinase A